MWRKCISPGPGLALVWSSKWYGTVRHGAVWYDMVRYGELMVYIIFDTNSCDEICYTLTFTMELGLGDSDWCTNSLCWWWRSRCIKIKYAAEYSTTLNYCTKGSVHLFVFCIKPAEYLANTRVSINDSCVSISTKWPHNVRYTDSLSAFPLTIVARLPLVIL